MRTRTNHATSTDTNNAPRELAELPVLELESDPAPIPMFPISFHVTHASFFTTFTVRAHRFVSCVWHELKGHTDSCLVRAHRQDAEDKT